MSSIHDVVDLKVVANCMVCNKLAEKRCTRCFAVFYCSVKCQKRDWKLHKETNCTPETEDQHFQRIVLDGGMKPCVEVKKSSIKKGDRVCYYAGRDDDARVRVRMRGGDKLTIVNAEEVFGSVSKDSDRCMAHPVDPETKEMKVRMGCEEPEGDFGLGQFINDAAKPKIDVGDDFSRASKAMNRYEDVSQAGANVEAKAHFWFRATKDISPGQELFTHYGFEFWTQKLLNSARHKEEKLLFYALSNQTNRPFDLRKFFKYEDETIRSFLTVLIGVPEEELEGKDAVKYLMELTPKIGIGAENITMIGHH